MEKNLHEATWEKYASVWSLNDHAKRVEILKTCTSEDCVYTYPLVQANGHQHLSGYMDEVLKSIPEVTFTKTWFNSHNDRCLVRWNMEDGKGHVLAEGASYLVFDADNKIKEMNGFFVPPTAG